MQGMLQTSPPLLCRASAGPSLLRGSERRRHPFRTDPDEAERLHIIRIPRSVLCGRKWHSRFHVTRPVLPHKKTEAERIASVSIFLIFSDHLSTIFA